MQYAAEKQHGGAGADEEVFLLLELLKLPPPPLMLAFLAYLNCSGSISCSCVDLVALLLSGLE